MATANTNTLDASPAIMGEEVRTFYDRTLLQRLLPNVIWPMFGQPRPMPMRSGQTVQFNGFDSLSAATTPLSEGVTPDGDTLSMNNITATPRQYGNYLSISDVVDMTAPDPVLTEAAELLGEQAADTVDQLVRDVVCGGTTNVQYASDAAGREYVSATISTTDLAKAIRTLRSNKVKKLTAMLNASTGIGTVPIAPAYVAIVGPKTVYDLKQLTGWVPVQEYSQTGALLPGEVGSWDEIRFVETHNPKIFSAAATSASPLDSPAADVHAAIILGRDGYGIVQVHGIQNIVKGYGAGDDPLNQRMTSGWKAFFTSVILQPLAVLRLEHQVSD